MSRYELPGREPGITIAVGWDAPLQSYFVQVYDARLPEDDNPVVWLGASLPRIEDINDLRQAIVPHADLPVLTASLLVGDRDEDR